MINSCYQIKHHIILSKMLSTEMASILLCYQNLNFKKCVIFPLSKKILPYYLFRVQFADYLWEKSWKKWQFEVGNNLAIINCDLYLFNLSPEFMIPPFQDNHFVSKIMKCGDLLNLLLLDSLSDYPTVQPNKRPMRGPNWTVWIKVMNQQYCYWPGS